MRFFVAALLLVCAVAGAAEFSVNGRTLAVPDGFTVELAAAPPLVDRPMHADFDELGRLYVADSSGSNDKVEKQLAEKPHRIVRLEDSDGDGRYDRSVVFADKMMLPHGAMWLDGSLYVATPPSIWKLTDTDDDGVADRREEWWKGGTLTGCANDLHGPFLGPDGWIYWCKGAFAAQTHEVNGQPFTSRASHVWRARPDGSRLEPVMTGGMDNPVELAFTPEGERIITCTFFQHPAAGRRDGLIHALYGGVYGKPHDVLDGHLRTGELMPPMTHLGPAAPAGLMRYRSRVFGAEYENDLFAALFNLHKVTRHLLQREGASFTTKDEDFLVSPDTDFHPTDALEDADGSLLIVDTGGWYKLCCPTSQLHKPDVLGAIYRVRRTGAPKIDDPRGLEIDWRAAPEQLVAHLGSARPAVAARAMSECANRGVQVVPALTAGIRLGAEPEWMLPAVWALARIDAPSARAAIRLALGSDDESVRHAAAHAASVWRDAAAAPALTALLASDQPTLQRVAAEALGRLGAAEAVPALLGSAQLADRALEHSVIHALIQVGDAARIAPVLRAGTPAARKAAVFALEQIGGKAKPQLEDVRPWLLSAAPESRALALWLVARHPEWANAVAEEVHQNSGASDAELDHRVALLALCAAEPSVQHWMATQIRGDSSGLRRELVLRAMARASLKEMPADWALSLTRGMNGRDDDLFIAALTAFPPPKALVPNVAELLLKVVGDGNYPAELRVKAAAGLPVGTPALPPAAFEFLSAAFLPGGTSERRGAAARAFTRAKLSLEQLSALVDLLNAVGPTDLPALLGLFSRSSDEALGLRLIEALRASPSRAALDAATLTSAFAGFPPSVREAAQALLVTAIPAEQRTHLETLAASLKDGDIRRGQAVFNSAKGACAMCHAIGYLGGNLGPDLTRIGAIRGERDLLEAIVFPSASFVRSYEPMLVTTKAGDIHNGIVRGESGEAVTLAVAAGSEVRVRRGELALMQPGAVSLMPQGFDQVLTAQELADLVAFLKAAR